MKFIGVSLCLSLAMAGTAATAQTKTDVDSWGGWDPGGWERDAGGAVSDTLKQARDVVGDIVAGMDPVEGAKVFANRQAADYHDSHGASGSFNDCVVLVAAACAAAGASIGAGPWGAALGGGAGVALADLSCRAWYP
jgi:hypothetical protein